MDFGDLLNQAKRNESYAKSEASVKRYTTEVKCAKKEPRSKVQSAAIRAFLQRKEGEERRKAEDAARQKEALLGLRSAAKHNRKASAMAKRTKDNNFGVNFNQLDEESKYLLEKEKARVRTQPIKTPNTPVTKPEKRNGHHSVLPPIRSSRPEERPRPTSSISSKKRPAPPPVDFHSLLQLAEQKQFEPIDIPAKKARREVEDHEPMSHERKRQMLEEKARKEGKSVNSVKCENVARRSSNVYDKRVVNSSVKSRIPVNSDKNSRSETSSNSKTVLKSSVADQIGAKAKKSPSHPIKSTRPPSSTSFRPISSQVNSLGRDVPREKTYAPIPNSSKISRPLDKSNRGAVSAPPAKKTDSKQKPIPKPSSNGLFTNKHTTEKGLSKTPVCTKPNSMNGSQRGVTGKPFPGRPLENGKSFSGKPLFKTEIKPTASRDVIPTKKPPSNVNTPLPKSAPSRPPVSKSNSSIIGKSGVDQRLLNAQNQIMKQRTLGSVANSRPNGTNGVVNEPMLLSKHVHNGEMRPPASGPRMFPPPDVRRNPVSSGPRMFPPPDVMRRDPFRRPMKRPPIKRRIEDDDDWDDEMDDFIDDGPAGNDEEDYSKYIREIFKYDKRKYVNYDDDDIEEASFSQLMKEEARSTRAGLLEDLEDIKREQQEKRLKSLAKKKQKAK